MGKIKVQLPPMSVARHFRSNGHIERELLNSRTQREDPQERRVNDNYLSRCVTFANATAKA